MEDITDHFGLFDEVNSRNCEAVDLVEAEFRVATCHYEGPPCDPKADKDGPIDACADDTYGDEYCNEADE